MDKGEQYAMGGPFISFNEAGVVMINAKPGRGSIYRITEVWKKNCMTQLIAT